MRPDQRFRRWWRRHPDITVPVTVFLWIAGVTLLLVLIIDGGPY